MKSITLLCFALLCISYISARNISNKSGEDAFANKAVTDGEDIKKDDAASGNTFSLIEI